MAATHTKPPVTGAGPFNGLLTWVDQRFPLLTMWREHAAEYYAPKNFNFWYYFGSLAMLVLVIQIVDRHLSHDALQARCGAGVRVGRIHHARRAGRVADPLHALDGRVRVLHRASICTCSGRCCTARIASRASCSGSSAC